MKPNLDLCKSGLGMLACRSAYLALLNILAIDSPSANRVHGQTLVLLRMGDRRGAAGRLCRCRASRPIQSSLDLCRSRLGLLGCRSAYLAPLHSHATD